MIEQALEKLASMARAEAAQHASPEARWEDVKAQRHADKVAARKIAFVSYIGTGQARRIVEALRNGEIKGFGPLPEQGE